MKTRELGIDCVGLLTPPLVEVGDVETDVGDVETVQMLQLKKMSAGALQLVQKQKMRMLLMMHLP